MPRNVLGILILSLVAVAAPVPARATWATMPQNNHQLFQTFGLFNDGQSALLYKGAAQGWGALAGSLAVLGDPESEARPQLLLHASLQAPLTLSASRFVVEELDLRAGAAWEFALNPAFRLSFAYTHFSAHPEAAVTGHALSGRLLYDLGPYGRAGFTLKPVLSMTPDARAWASDQFVELFPLGGTDDPRSPSPYIALGLEQGGTEAFGLANTFHAQVGAYLGNHFAGEHRQTLRGVLGFHTGADPRLKRFVLEDRRDTYGYLGLMADL